MCGAAASLAAFSSKLGADTDPQPSQELQEAVHMPLKHVAAAAVDQVMAQHANSSSGEGGGLPGQAAATAPAAEGALPPLLSYHDVQQRQQRVVCLLQQRGLHLDVERHRSTATTATKPC